MRAARALAALDGDDAVADAPPAARRPAVAAPPPAPRPARRHRLPVRASTACWPKCSAA
ncbi:MAG: hypothetical protein MZW92_70810 [Comamonadaceae bacterium]|nr:hypothetical protein [Comamonadaceae bacterium]